MNKHDSKFLFAVQIQTPSKMKEFMIQESEFIIGRNKECGVCVSEPSLSRQHLRVSVIHGKIMVADLGSSNGSFLDGKKMNPFQEIEFHPQSKVKLGTKETWLTLKVIENDLPKAQSSKSADSQKDQNASPQIDPAISTQDEYVAPRAPSAERKVQQQVVLQKNQEAPKSRSQALPEPFVKSAQQSFPQSSEVQKEEEFIRQEIQKRKAIHEKDFQEWMQHQKEKQDIERQRIAEELENFRKEKMIELDQREAEIESKYAALKNREKDLQYEYQTKNEQFDKVKHEFEQQKANLIFDAEAQGEIEYQRKYKEAQLLLQDAEKRSHTIVNDAKNEAQKVKLKNEEDVRHEIAKIKEKNENLRQQLENELKEIRELSQREQEGYIHEAREESKKIIAEADKKRAEIILKAEDYEKQIKSECESVLEKTRAEAVKKSAALFDDILQKETKQKDLENQIKSFEEKAKIIQQDLDSHRSEIVKLQAEAHQLRDQNEGLKKLEEKKKQILLECENIRKSADEYAQTKKQETDEQLREFEKTLQQKKEKESSVLDEVKKKINLEIESEQANFRMLLSENKHRFSESLTQFLQVYSVENPEFDFKKPKNDDVEKFKKAFHQNILKEIGEEVDAGPLKGRKKSRAPQFALAAMSFLLAVLFIPKLLPDPWNEKVSLLSYFDIEKSSSRFIASLQEQRERKVETQKVKQIFESYVVSTLLTENFYESRKDDDYLKNWYRKAQKDFFKKYRVPEERMIQLLAKETSLVSSLQDLLSQSHPDYFSITYGKMKNLEQKSLNEMKQSLGNDLAFVEFIEVSRTFFQNYYFRPTAASSTSSEE